MNKHYQANPFRKSVETTVSSIPSGKVMTYGQIAALCGNPRAARIVGGVAHYGDSRLPWHRVVNKHGGLARGYPGGPKAQARHLRSEGIKVSDDYRVDMNEYWYQPAMNGDSRD